LRASLIQGSVEVLRGVRNSYCDGTVMHGCDPFRHPRKPSLRPTVLNVVTIVLVALCVAFGYLILRDRPPEQRMTSSPKEIQSISVIDGDTVRFEGKTYRLVGFDTPERGDRAGCDDERRRADTATNRLRGLLSDTSAHLERVSCGCKPGDEGTTRCNYGRMCGRLTIGGRDVGQILIQEGLAYSYVCNAGRCPPKRSWCG
jgi:endonuclease YncB( thermonuclease family)